MVCRWGRKGGNLAKVFGMKRWLFLQQGGTGLPELGGGAIVLDESAVVARGERAQDPHIHRSTRWLRAETTLAPPLGVGTQGPVLRAVVN